MSRPRDDDKLAKLRLEFREELPTPVEEREDAREVMRVALGRVPK